MSDGYVVLCADQTALRRAEQHFQTVVTSLDEGVVVIAAGGEVESVNPAALRIMGVPPSAVDDAIEFAKLATVPIYDRDGALFSLERRSVRQLLTSKLSRGSILGFDRLTDGQRIWVSASWSLLDPTNPARSSVLISFVDVTENHNAHRQLLHQATHDPLTGLPNRAHLLTLVAEFISPGQHRLAAVLFIDFDNFKAINDALGHHAGDTVLQIAGQRLNQALGPGDVVGRVGGDEFVALLSTPAQRTEIDNLANRLHAALAEPIAVASRSGSTATHYVCISASIGLVTVRPHERRGAEEILRDADSAMYEAKRTGHATSRYEHKGGRRSVIDSLRARVRRAIDGAR